MWRLSSFRLLCVIFGLAGLAAMWEVSHVRNGFHRNVPPNVNQTEVMENLAKTYLELYPDRGMPHYVRGAISLKSQDYESARTHIERSLSMKNYSENVLYDHALNLIMLGESKAEVDDAIKRWRWHYPKSNRPDPRERLGVVPAEDSADYLAGREALLSSDFEKARYYFERDLSKGINSEQLLYNYALTLLLLGESERVVAAAIGRWRSTYPNSELMDPREAYRRLTANDT